VLVDGDCRGVLGSVVLPVPGAAPWPSRRRALGRGLTLLLLLSGVCVLLGALAGAAQADEPATEVVQDVRAMPAEGNGSRTPPAPSRREVRRTRPRERATSRLSANQAAQRPRSSSRN